MNCPKCGFENPLNAKYCGKCANIFASSNQSNEPKIEVMPQQKQGEQKYQNLTLSQEHIKKPNKSLFWIGIGILIITLLLNYFYWSSNISAITAKWITLFEFFVFIINTFILFILAKIFKIPNNTYSKAIFFVGVGGLALIAYQFINLLHLPNIVILITGLLGIVGWFIFLAKLYVISPGKCIGLGISTSIITGIIGLILSFIFVFAGLLEFGQLLNHLNQPVTTDVDINIDINELDQSVQDIDNGEINLDNMDSDNDGLINYDEINIWLTDPNNPDTDGDGYEDGNEVENGYDPLIPGSARLEDRNEAGNSDLIGNNYRQLLFNEEDMKIALMQAALEQGMSEEEINEVDLPDDSGEIDHDEDLYKKATENNLDIKDSYSNSFIINPSDTEVEPISFGSSFLLFYNIKDAEKYFDISKQETLDNSEGVTKFKEISNLGEEAFTADVLFFRVIMFRYKNYIGMLLILALDDMSDKFIEIQQNKIDNL